mmetsp:Transcript_30011/g.66472  ORF Transcript_30011/g.66472 Transcript_30011/m.66472 type:complete len:80 (-) Transcript_30011:569-808(-)
MQRLDAGSNNRMASAQSSCAPSPTHVVTHTKADAQAAEAACCLGADGVTPHCVVPALCCSLLQVVVRMCACSYMQLHRL